MSVERHLDIVRQHLSGIFREEGFAEQKSLAFIALNWRKSSWSPVSTPSARTFIFRLWARAMIAREIVALLWSVATYLSIFSLLTGK